jgi:hypothetical protein
MRDDAGVTHTRVLGLDMEHPTAMTNVVVEPQQGRRRHVSEERSYL